MAHSLAESLANIYRVCSKALYPVLNGLSEQQLNWKPAPESRSISEIYRHLIRVDAWFLKQFQIQPAVQDPGETHAAHLLDSLRQSHQYVLDLLRACQTPADLRRQSPAPELAGHNTLAEAIIHMAQHYLYHLAQVIYLRRAQDRAWPPPQAEWEHATYVLSDHLLMIQQIKAVDPT